jgi:hypothetical protein
MKIPDVFPAFDDCLPDLNHFILELVEAYEAGTLKSWDDLEEKVHAFFTPERMEEMETLVPGWQTMASYSEGITLVHVMCVFLGLFMLPEFRSLWADQQQMAKWIVLLHDVDKIHLRGKKDSMHAFRSGILAANLLSRFGFPTRTRFHERIDFWGEYTAGAYLLDTVNSSPRPDNRKLPAILVGIDNLFGQDTPAALITKTVLLHISPAVDPFYPTPAPLTDEEIKRFISPSLFPLLRAMMLSDNEGWSLFNPETRTRQRHDTIEAFGRFQEMISG